MPKKRSKKRLNQKSTTRWIIASAIIILALVLARTLRLEFGTSVLGTQIAAGKQLQIETIPLPTASNMNTSDQPAASGIKTSNPPAASTPDQSLPPSIFKPACPLDGGIPISSNPADNPPACDCFDGLFHCDGSGRCDDRGDYCARGVAACKIPNNNIIQNQPQGWYCAFKPVIYLYPTKQTLVDVKMTMEQGFVTASNPLYDEQFKGWSQVLANPDGTLLYRGKKYSELFYETANQNLNAPDNGIIIPKNQLKAELTRITTALGLLPNEQSEFLSFWVDRLNSLNSPYILFSVINGTEKNRIDNVSFSPKPDTFIYFLAYFKGIDQPIKIKPLDLPKTPPKRIGFTAVEWGGIVEHKN